MEDDSVRSPAVREGKLRKSFRSEGRVRIQPSLTVGLLTHQHLHLSPGERLINKE